MAKVRLNKCYLNNKINLQLQKIHFCSKKERDKIAFSERRLFQSVKMSKFKEDLCSENEFREKEK
jgi:hypothetical protein